MNSAHTLRIREQNDSFRKTPSRGPTYLTAGVTARGDEFCKEALAAVARFDGFTSNNDPYGEHDFGSVTISGEKLFWKIDYYDLTLSFGSKDPSDPSQTKRVLTIMLAEEY